jgi:hypothetical protein
MTGTDWRARADFNAWSVRRIASRIAEEWKPKDFHLPNGLKQD